MKEIVMLSGKGGTGKTTLLSSFAFLDRRPVIVDCDVDAANLHLVMNPEVEERIEFWCGDKAWIDREKCVDCGICREICRFDAIRSTVVDELSCEGCGLCARMCPAGAIIMRENLSGEWYRSRTRYGPLFHARLGPGQGNSGKLVALLRQEARTLAEQSGAEYVLCDGPPGTGCPVISSLSGVDLALLVTEPSLSGLHDLKRIIGVCRHFQVPILVCLNRFDLNREVAARIQQFCQEEDIELVAKIPFDSTVAYALGLGIPVVECSRGRAAGEIRFLWDRIRTHPGFVKKKRYPLTAGITYHSY